MPTPWDVMRRSRKKFPALTGDYKEGDKKIDRRKNNPGQKKFK